MHDLEDDLVQSVWLKGGFSNNRDIYFCHFYREHTSTLGSSISTQREQLGKFLTQWEEATVHNNSHGINEVHISGDMNLDSLSGRWLQSDYHLVTLSRLVQTSCNLGNFSQLVQVPTRYQYNNTKQETDYSCIDHVYTNSRLRCSGIMVTPFGSSDHDLVGYFRLTKIPPEPSRTIRKRSYKNFVLEEFLEDLKSVDWSEVLIETDVDMGVEVFTEKFLNVLDLHAPWIKFQRRKHYSPWLTKETKELIKCRDNWKAVSEDLAKAGATEAWNKFKQVRNKVNNRKKYEENRFKAEKIRSTLDSPAQTWATTKGFYGLEGNWRSP